MAENNRFTNVQKFDYNKKKGIDDIDGTQKWWKTDPERMYQNTWAAANYISQQQSSRRSVNKICRALYENNQWKGNASLDSVLQDMTDRLNRQISFNVIKSCVDTARAKIAKNKPRPFFLTESGNWHLQQKAQRLNQFVLGMFDDIGGDNGLVRDNLYKIGAHAFFDAALTGTGAVKMLVRDEKIVCERFLNDEIIVDHYEGQYMRPRSMHHVKWIDRDVLRATYPEAKFAGMIESVANKKSSQTQDLVPVIESWHLPSGKKAKDGVRAVCIETGTLHFTKWDKPYFPMLIQRWNLRPTGFFGIGLGEELYGIQCEISRTLRSIQLGLRRVAVPRVFRHISDHNAKNLSNISGEMHYYRDKPPIFNTPTAFTVETYNYLEMLYQKAFQLTGISQLSSQAQKPAGLDSGVALRNFQDIESERFAEVHLMYENFYTPQSTYMLLDHLDSLLEAGVDVKVKAKDGMTLQPLKYSDVKIDREDFSVRAFPTAYLPSEPSGKFAKAQEMINSGMYEVDEAREILDFPDLSKINRVKLAPRRAVMAYIEKIIDSGKYMPVEPYQDLELTQKMAQSYYLEGRTNGMPEERLNLLRKVMNETKAKIQDIQAKQMEQQQAAMAAQQAAAMPPEQAQLAPAPELQGAV